MKADAKESNGEASEGGDATNAANADGEEVKASTNQDEDEDERVRVLPGGGDVSGGARDGSMVDEERDVSIMTDNLSSVSEPRYKDINLVYSNHLALGKHFSSHSYVRTFSIPCPCPHN